MAATLTELQSVATETVQMKLVQGKSSVSLTPQPPGQSKPKGRIRLDPQRALEPARKKLSTLEAQRIMAVLEQSIKKVQLVTALPNIVDNLERYRIVLGTDLTRALEEHKVIVQSFQELKKTTEKKPERHRPESSKDNLKPGDTDPDRQEDPLAKDNSERMEMAIHNLTLVAKQMQFSCKNIMRLFSLNPPAMNSVLKDQERSEEVTHMIAEMLELKDIIMGMLLTSPLEESERNQYLRQIFERERYNANIIDKLEVELDAANEEKEAKIRVKNDVIRRLQADLHQIQKFSEEHLRRTKSEAEKQEAADLKNSDGKKLKLQQEAIQLRTQLQSLVAEHRETEQGLRKRKFKIETEVENWIQKYDQDMGERQAEYEEIDEVYTKKKKVPTATLR